MYGLRCAKNTLRKARSKHGALKKKKSMELCYYRNLGKKQRRYGYGGRW